MNRRSELGRVAEKATTLIMHTASYRSTHSPPCAKGSEKIRICKYRIRIDRPIVLENPFPVKPFLADHSDSPFDFSAVRCWSVRFKFAHSRQGHILTAPDNASQPFLIVVTEEVAATQKNGWVAQPGVEFGPEQCEALRSCQTLTRDV